MRVAFVCLVAGLVLSQAALAESKKDWDDCVSSDADRSIAGCTKLIDRAKDTKNNLAIAYFNRGVGHQNKREYAEAIADFNQSIKLNASDPAAYRNRGFSYAQTGEYDLAIDDYNQTIKLKPDYPSIYYDRGWTYAGKQDEARALNDYNRAIALDKENPNLFSDRGRTYAELDDLDHALADFEKAIALDPNHALGHANRGWVMAMRNKQEEAIAEYSQALRVEPGNADNLNARGYAFIKTDQFDRAIADFDEALKLKPDFEDALSNRGWAYALKGDSDKALADYDEVIRRSPANVDALNDRGSLFDDKGDIDRSLADYEKVLALQPDNGRALNGRAWAHGQKGEFDQALADAERSVAILKDDPNAIHTRAWIYMNKGQLDLALADFDRAVSIDPELAGAYADRGRAYELKGDRDKAIADYRKSLSLKTRQRYDDKAKAAALQHLTALAAVAPGAAVVAGSADRDATKPNAPIVAEKRIALVIGNGAYANVKALKNADSDASAVAASLQRLGFEVIEKHDLTLADLTRELKAFGDRAPTYDWALVYYAGHGIEVGGINYLIPVDAELATASHVDDEAMPLDRVLAKVEGARKLRLVILDACRENPFAAKMASAGATRSIGRGLARIEPEAGVLVAYSAKDGQVAQDGDGVNSPFAQSLLKYLGEPGLEINILFRRVHDDVKTATSGQQTPFTYGALPAEALYFKAAGQ